MDHWAQGIIGHPEPGSLDREKSSEKPAGHSVLVVGFDDNKIVKKKIQMADGTSKMFTYKGVYYIKNSWGTESFGSEFEVDGVNYPGYGMIVQKHANQDGSFFALQ
jgi:C1A family cysteine protease